MKRYILILSAALGVCAFANAQEKVEIVKGVAVNNLKIEKDAPDLYIDMEIDLSNFDVKRNRVVTLTPRLVNGRDSLDLQSVTVYGRKRYIYYQRKEMQLGGADELAYKSSDKPEAIKYSQIVDYQPWMNGATLRVVRMECGCCGDVESEEIADLGNYKEYIYSPKFAFVRPAAELRKNRELKGSAFIDFVVSTTDIRPEYRQNKREIAKITGTIDSVRNDKDIKVNSISIKGFASPESPYSNNTRLAKGRTKALCDYVNGLYNFPKDFIKTSYEPEDWEGLRKFVEASDKLANKEAILKLIDSDREPDNKEWAIKSQYPEDYKYLLHNSYPAFRHSDYKIDYTISNFTDVEEIKRLVKEKPQKLSLNEFYLAAQAYEPGSDDFNEVFEVAVRMYPNDEVANLNAANTALGKGDFKAAEKYLAKAGNSAEAQYTRGVVKAMQKDYKGAAAIFETVKDKVPQAAETLKELKEYKLI